CACSESLAAHRLDPQVVQARLGLCVVAPVEHPMLPDLAEIDRNVDKGMEIAATGFQEQHADRGVGGETISEDAAGRAGADDDVVVDRSRGHGYASPRTGGL